MATSNPGVPAASHQPVDGSQAEVADLRWKGLYGAGAAAALLSAIITPISVGLFIAWQPPLEGTALDWFNLFRSNAFRGLVGLDLPFMVVYALLIPIWLALYAALRRAGESAMAIAAALGLVAIAVYFASNPAFEMLSLSRRYDAATTEAQRSILLAAGEAVLAGFQGTAFKVSYLLATGAGIITGIVILRSKILGKPTGYARLLASFLGLGIFIPTIGVPLSLFSVLFEWIWYVLLGRGLFRLARSSPRRRF